MGNELSLVSRWLETTGGPFVVLPASRASSWRGAETDDYSDACRVEDYAGVLQRPWGDVLVLGDEPMRTATVHRPDGLVIVRWMYAPNAETLVHAALHLDVAHAPVAERVRFAPVDGLHLVLDAADAGDLAETIDVRVPEGATGIITHVVKDPGREVAFVLHRFV